MFGITLTRTGIEMPDKAFRTGNGKLFQAKVGRVAQLVEQCPFKAWVAGSSPAALTSSFNGLPLQAQRVDVN